MAKKKAEDPDELVKYNIRIRRRYVDEITERRKMRGYTLDGLMDRVIPAGLRQEHIAFTMAQQREE